jgi:DNA-binding HxlR family transcriptional regulator
MQVKNPDIPKMPSPRLSAPIPPNRRSPCPVACSLDLLGDRWTLLVIRDLLLGRTRFKEFLASPEGIPTNILTNRLNRLVEYQLAAKVADSTGSKHLRYQLTPKGQALLPVLEALKTWGLDWEPGTCAHLTA